MSRADLTLEPAAAAAATCAASFRVTHRIARWFLVFLLLSEQPPEILNLKVDDRLLDRETGFKISK
jgi:hypothetical protein